MSQLERAFVRPLPRLVRAVTCGTFAHLRRKQDVSMPPLTESWRTVAISPDYALATWQQIFAVIWRHETTMEGAAHLRAACTAFAKDNPSGIGLLTIVEAGAPLPGGPARKEIASFLADASSFIKCSAVIFEGSGFRAASVRSVVTGLTLVARQAYPHKVCDLDEAARMFAEILPRATGRTVSADAMRSSLAVLRSSFTKK